LELGIDTPIGRGGEIAGATSADHTSSFIGIGPSHSRGTISLLHIHRGDW